MVELTQVNVPAVGYEDAKPVSTGIRELQEFDTSTEFELGTIREAWVLKVEVAARKVFFPEAKKEELKFGGTLEDDLIRITFGDEKHEVLGTKIVTKRYSPQSNLHKFLEKYKNLKVGQKIIVSKNDLGNWEVMI